MPEPRNQGLPLLSDITMLARAGHVRGTVGTPITNPKAKQIRKPRGATTNRRSNDAGLHATTILFDLDGTLIDSAPGILNSLHEAFDDVGLKWSDNTFDERLIGPPIYEALPPLIGDRATRTVLPVFRRIYADHGLLESKPFPGVDSLLRKLSERGRRLALATSKNEIAARQILANLGWTPLFAVIVGDTHDAQRPTKAAVIAEALHQIEPPPHRTVMVGDRCHDVIGSRQNGLPCIGAGWGYGQPDELLRAGAAITYNNVADVAAALAPPTAALRR